ncbi:MAG: D-alanyl-D-alanine carboxypeptidase family protein [Clostridia bacterium]|jgi:D-alanyl-D-alanine carboxypeptidase (penicillin-binding protein 5/6)
MLHRIGMKKIIFLLVTLFLFLATTPVTATSDDYTESTTFANLSSSLQEDQITASGAILMDARTGKILYEKNSNEKYYPASTTKIMTALLAFEKGNLDDPVTADRCVYYLGRGSSIIGLKPDETMTLRELLYGLLLESGNDAAVAIAVHIGGSVEGFADMMNAKAKELGLSNTHFTNPHGLHDPDHYTTAADLARIALEARKYPEFREMVNTYVYKKGPTNLCDTERTWINSNRLISTNPKEPYRYEYATGMKTGYTSKAKHSLVATALRDDMELLTVVLHDSKEGKWKSTICMFEWGFENFTSRKLVQDEDKILATVDVKDASSEDAGKGKLELLVDASDNPYTTLPKGDFTKITEELAVDSDIRAPIRSGQVLGKVVYKLNGDVLFEKNLIASRDVEKKKALFSVTETVKSSSFSSSSPWWWLVVPAVLLLGLISRILYVHRRKKRRRYLYHYYSSYRR